MITLKRYYPNRLVLILFLFGLRAIGQDLANLLPSINPLALPSGATTALWVPGGYSWVDTVFFDLKALSEDTSLTVLEGGRVLCQLIAPPSQAGVHSCEIRARASLIYIKNVGKNTIHLNEAFAQIHPREPRYEEWVPPANPVRRWHPFRFPELMALLPGRSVSIPLNHQWVEAEAIYLSLLGGYTPCEGLYVVVNGEIKSRLNWSMRRGAYWVPIESPLHSIELVNTCDFPFQIHNLYAQPLPENENYLGAKKVMSLSLKQLQLSEQFSLPLHIDVPEEAASLKSVVLVAELPKGTEKTDPAELVLATKQSESKLLITKPGINVLSIPVFQRTSVISLRQLSGPKVRVKEVTLAYYVDRKPIWIFGEGFWRNVSPKPVLQGKLANQICKRLIEATERLKNEVPTNRALPSIIRIQHSAILGELASQSENSDLSAVTLLAMKDIWETLVESSGLIDYLLDVPVTKLMAEELIRIKLEIEPRIAALLQSAKR